MRGVVEEAAHLQRRLQALLASQQRLLSSAALGNLQLGRALDGFRTRAALLFEQQSMPLRLGLAAVGYVPYHRQHVALAGRGRLDQAEVGLDWELDARRASAAQLDRPLTDLAS